VVACKDWNDVPAGPAGWRRVSTTEEGEFPHLFVAFLSNACNHCAEPTCVSVCPAGAITKREDNGIVIVDREKCQENSRCGIISEGAMGTTFRYGEGESPCRIACPAHLSVPGYVALISKGRFKEALNLIRQDMPLPSVCGRVCVAPCEKECRRQELDQSIAIAALKRFVTECVNEALPSPVPQTKQEKVAIIGSGPAGLAAAHDLVRKGYAVTVYEALPAAGGMLAWGIPPYRLPREVLEKDINYIQALGVEIKTNTPLGPGLTLDDLAAQGYGAVLLALGAQESIKLKIPGANLSGALAATSFLRDFNLGKKVEMGNKVVVLGGGNVAIDSARTALRLGAAEVHVACLECRKDMPAVISEIEGAEQEGVMIHPSVTATRILGESRVAGVEFLSLKGVEFDEDGLPHMDIIEGTGHVLAADTVIFAVGQKPDLSSLRGTEGIELSKQGTIAAHTGMPVTQRHGVFACGDVVNGPTNVIEAITCGQRAAFWIDRYLQGYVLRRERVERVKPSEVKVEIPTDVEKQERRHMPSLPTQERILNFSEVDLGYNLDDAVAEAKRCLNCAGHLCRDVCPYNAPQFGAEEKSKMQKCDFCQDRWTENKKPICVDACPMYALDAGLLSDMENKYGSVKEAIGFEYSPEIVPSVVVKPRFRESKKPTS